MINFIIGAGGFAREVDYLLYDINKKESISGYFVSKEHIGSVINGKEVINDDKLNELLTLEVSNGYIAIGKPSIRKSIYSRLKSVTNIRFPSAIHPSVLMDERVNKIQIDIGTLICAGNILTTDISIGKFVHINLDCTVGHDVRMGDFITISPGCHISGNVTLEQGVFLGTGAVILEGLKVCAEAIIGAGAVVTKNIDIPGVYVGAPAKMIKSLV